MTLHVLSAGAAKAVVSQIGPQFSARTGSPVDYLFSAVGEIRDELLAGRPCDVVVLSQALIDELGAGAHLRSGTVAPLGSVRTGLGVRAGDPVPPVADAEAVRDCLLAAPAIYAADLTRSTGGRHLAAVLHRLGIHDTVQSRVRAYQNGALALAALAASGEPGAVGCSQLTEFMYTPGTMIAGPLPEPLGLSTVYTVAVASASPQPDLAGQLASWLTSEASAEARREHGFES